MSVYDTYLSQVPMCASIPDVVSIERDSGNNQSNTWNRKPFSANFVEMRKASEFICDVFCDCLDASSSYITPGEDMQQKPKETHNSEMITPTEDKQGPKDDQKKHQEVATQLFDDSLVPTVTTKSPS